MPSPLRSRPRPSRPSLDARSTLRLIAATVAGLLIASLPPAVSAASYAAPVGSGSLGARAEGQPSEPVPVRITQANLLSGQPEKRFKQDLRSVFAENPDFITYNEVPYRPDNLLAPDGYQLWRSPGRYQSATPVAWRSDRWSPLTQGTLTLSHRRGKVKGKKVEWGIRYANWVTLTGASGQRISVVSAHLPPKHKITEGLAQQSIRRLGRLATTLRASGPVLFGGDFNMHYPSRDYLRAQLNRAGMTPTYDVLGSYAPTGIHRGATIDYIFMSPVTSFNVVAQHTTKLNSDHLAVTADLTFVPTGAGDEVRFVKGPRTNVPTGNRAARRGVLDLMESAIENAPRGAGIHLVTTTLSDGKIYRALRKAEKRGVKIQFVTRNKRPNRKERALFRLLKGRVKTREFAVPCRSACRRIERKGRLPQTSLMVSNSGSTRALRIDSDRPAAFRSTKSLTRAKVKTNKRSYDYMFNLFLKLVRRRL